MGTVDPKTQICAGYVNGGVDGCQGDRYVEMGRQMGLFCLCQRTRPRQSILIHTHKPTKITNVVFSGGPLLGKLGNSLPDAILLGVVSWGDGCAVPGKYGIYMSIDQYIPWMLGKMGGMGTSNGQGSQMR